MLSNACLSLCNSHVIIAYVWMNHALGGLIIQVLLRLVPTLIVLAADILNSIDISECKWKLKFSKIKTLSPPQIGITQYVWLILSRFDKKKAEEAELIWNGKNVIKVTSTWDWLIRQGLQGISYLWLVQCYARELGYFCFLEKVCGEFESSSSVYLIGFFYILCNC